MAGNTHVQHFDPLSENIVPQEVLTDRAVTVLSWYVVTLQVHGQKAVWEDPVEWVRGTLPWPSAQQDQAKLFHLPPPSVGSCSPGQTIEETPHKETTPSAMESDPLVRASSSCQK